MKFTLGEIRWMKNGLVSLSKDPLPVKVSYKLSKLLNRFNTELAAIEEARVQLVKKMSSGPNEQGVTSVPSDKEEQFKKEFGDLLMEEIEIAFSPIPLSEFGDNMKMSILDMSSLSKIIE